MEEPELDFFTSFITNTFGPALHIVFDPINNALANWYGPWPTICALSLFIGAMIWVFTLQKQYVNIDAPSTKWYHDLRFWVVLSMTPHVLVYLYFANMNRP